MKYLENKITVRVKIIVLEKEIKVRILHELLCYFMRFCYFEGGKKRMLTEYYYRAKRWTLNFFFSKNNKRQNFDNESFLTGLFFKSLQILQLYFSKY